MEDKSIQLFPDYTDVYYWNRDSKQRFRVNQGGTSSSKTYSIMQLLSHIAIEEQGARITVVADQANSLERGALRDFKTLINTSPLLEFMLDDPSLKTGPFYFKNKSFVEFINLKDASKAKHGKRDYLFLNEANHIDYSAATQLMVRTAKVVFIDYNPDAQFWVHTDIVPREDCEFFISNFTHNQHCPKNTIVDLMESRDKFFSSGDRTLYELWESTGDKTYYDRWLKTADSYNRNRWQVYGLGLTGVVEGVVFDSVTWIDYLPFDMRYNAYCIDFGQGGADPTTVSKIGCLSDRDVYAKELLYEPQINAFDLAERLPELGVTRQDLIIADTNYDSILILQRAGFNVVPAYKPPNSRKTGTDALKAKNIHITRDSTNWKREQQTHKYKEVNGVFLNEPSDKNDHLWDPMRYWQQHFYKVSKVSKKSRRPRRVSGVR